MFFQRLSSRLGTASLALVVTAAPAIAHPHAWIDVRLEIVFDDAGRFAAVREHWALDTTFTFNEVLPFVDADGNRELSPAEVDRAVAHYFGWIGYNRYFTRIAVDGGVVPFVDQPVPGARFADGVFFVDAELRLEAPVVIRGNAAIDVLDVETNYSFDFPRVGSDRPGPRIAADAPIAGGAIVAVNPPAGCSVTARSQLVPEAAVALAGQTPNDSAAGYPARAVVFCR